MCHLHKRGCKNFAYLVMFDMLDRFPLALRQEVAHKSDQKPGSEPTPEPGPATRLAMPGLQLTPSRRTGLSSLLVWEGDQPETHTGTPTALLRSNLL